VLTFSGALRDRSFACLASIYGADPVKPPAPPPSATTAWAAWPDVHPARC